MSVLGRFMRFKNGFQGTLGAFQRALGRCKSSLKAFQDRGFQKASKRLPSVFKTKIKAFQDVSGGCRQFQVDQGFVSDFRRFGDALRRFWGCLIGFSRYFQEFRGLARQFHIAFHMGFQSQGILGDFREFRRICSCFFLILSRLEDFFPRRIFRDS